MSSSNPPWESGSPWAQNFSPTVCGAPWALPTKMPPSAARCWMALAVHGALAGPMSMVSQPVQRTPSTIAAMIAAVARRPSPATTTVGSASSASGRRRDLRNSPGKLDRDPPRHIRAQIVDRHIADPFRVKQRRLLGPRTDFRQLANLPRRRGRRYRRAEGNGGRPGGSWPVAPNERRGKSGRSRPDSGIRRWKGLGSRPVL